MSACFSRQYLPILVPFWFSAFGSSADPPLFNKGSGKLKKSRKKKSKKTKRKIQTKPINKKKTNKTKPKKKNRKKIPETNHPHPATHTPITNNQQTDNVAKSFSFGKEFKAFRHKDKQFVLKLDVAKTMFYFSHLSRKKIMRCKGFFSFLNQLAHACISLGNFKCRVKKIILVTGVFFAIIRSPIQNFKFCV